MTEQEQRELEREIEENEEPYMNGRRQKKRLGTFDRPKGD